jgi:hypothetical protein
MIEIGPKSICSKVLRVAGDAFTMNLLGSEQSQVNEPDAQSSDLINAEMLSKVN